MKFIAFDMMKFKSFIIFTLFFGILANAQNNYEREHRVKRSQFPSKALEYLEERLEDARRIRFYQEIDSASNSYEAKFKKDKLWYGTKFDVDGNLKDVEIRVKEVDIPSDSWQNIQQYLASAFDKYRIRKINQQYVVAEGRSPEKTMKDAFQNLLLPDMNYELIIAGKKEKGFAQYEVLFDADGNYFHMRKLPHANYDHVLY